MYDKAKKDMRNITKELDEYLERQRKRLGCRVREEWAGLALYPGLIFPNSNFQSWGK